MKYLFLAVILLGGCAGKTTVSTEVNCVGKGAPRVTIEAECKEMDND